MSSPDHANRLDEEICRIEAFFHSSFEADCPTWTKMLLIEDVSKFYEDGTYRVPRSALLTRDEYLPSFDQILDVCSWINFNAIGILGDSLIINLEYPAERKEHGRRHMVSINLSGPRLTPLRDVFSGDETRIERTVQSVPGLGEMELEWYLDDKVIVL